MRSLGERDEPGQGKHGSKGEPGPGRVGLCLRPRSVLYQQKRHRLMAWGAASLGEGSKKTK